jgi:putative heme-binding domain-containing protein
VPKDVSPHSPHQHYAEDQLLPRAEDGNGFGVGIKPPGGFVVRMDADARNCELFAAGFRNTYDIAFNPDGELFGFDSDMEWDWGMPWYRPIRFNHIVSGGDYGFREGTGKFPNHYPDTLPTTLDVGIGSPTGLKFGTQSNFPEFYRTALFAMDWSYGRILTVHFQPKGASYTGTFENFVAPASLHSPGPKATLNLTDLEFGHNGALYFITGGRGTQSGLYRVSYHGQMPEAASLSAPDPAEVSRAAAARSLRHQLEAFHGRQDPAAVDFAWPHLDSQDRWIRYAARIAVESQPVDQWQARALREERVNAALTALLALARVGPPDAEKLLIQAVDRFRWDVLTEEQQVDALRVLSLAFIRMGKPNRDLAQTVMSKLDGQYPAKSWLLNRELAQILIYLEAPNVVARTLQLLDSAGTQEQQIHYLFYLRTLNTGWTLAQRRQYFDWFDRDWSHGRHAPEVPKWFTDAGREYDNGASFPKFMAHFRQDAVASLNDRERRELAAVIDRLPVPLTPSELPPRAFVKEWKIEDLLPALDQVSPRRDFAKGKQAFTAAQCIACHRFGSEGGSVGPDLTAVSSRFTRRDILESILEPSKVLSEQYQNMTVFKKDGDDVTGRVVEDTSQKLVLVTNPLTQEKVEVRKSDVREVVASRVSPMPEGLVNTFGREEILDLIAYLESGGRPEHTAAVR